MGAGGGGGGWRMVTVGLRCCGYVFVFVFVFITNKRRVVVTFFLYSFYVQWYAIKKLEKDFILKSKTGVER